MKLTRFNPTRAFGRVANFDDLFRNPFTHFNALSHFLDWENSPSHSRQGGLATDIHEDQDHYYARFEVPGVKKEDVKLELNDRLLTVSVEKKTQGEGGESRFSYTRSISVPDSIKAEGIAAKLEDGILTVTLPKSEESKPRNIQVS